MVVQGVRLETAHGFQVSPKSKTVEMFPFKTIQKEKILEIGDVGKVSSILIKNICLVENLKHNLISISQLCDKGYKVVFDKSKCVICDGKILFVENKYGNVYTIDIVCIYS